MGYIYLTSVSDHAQMAFVESILKAGGVRYNIGTEVASRVIPGLGLNQSGIYVHPHDYDKARQLLEDVEKHAGQPKSRFTKKKKKTHKKRSRKLTDESHDDDSAGRYDFVYAVLLVLGVAFIVALIIELLVSC